VLTIWRDYFVINYATNRRAFCRMAPVLFLIQVVILLQTKGIHSPIFFGIFVVLLAVEAVIVVLIFLGFVSLVGAYIVASGLARNFGMSLGEYAASPEYRESGIQKLLRIEKVRK
jgi:hypothetical protein